jgi:trk system potassium uptake protein TrkA
MLKVVVFGLGRFGAAVASTLYAQGAEVLAIDRNHRLVEEIKDRVSVAIATDATQRAILEAYDVGHMDVAIIGIGSNFEASVVVALHCRELGVPRIIAKALTPLQAQVLRAVGAHRVITPEEEIGERLAEHLVRGTVVDFVELPAGYSLRRLRVPAEWAGKSLADLKLLGEKHLNLIQIVRPGPGGRDFIHAVLPTGSDILNPGDLIDVIGPDNVMDKYV